MNKSVIVVVHNDDMQNKKTKKVATLKSQRRIEMFFFAVMVAIPTLQVLIFYFGVNINSVLMAFKKYNIETQQYYLTFENFGRFFTELKESNVIIEGLLNSLKAGFWTILVGVSLGIIFSLYIYNKFFGAKFFKVMLFMPSIVSAIVLTTMFQKFVNQTLPIFIEDAFGIEVRALLSGDTAWATLVFFNLWISFGSPVLLYVGAMNGISESISEAAKLDGANFVQESIYVTIPMIWPTIVTFVTVGLAAILTNQFSVYSFYTGGNYNSGIHTFGYWFFSEVKNGELNPETVYPYFAAVGILCSIVAIPVTIGIRKLLSKIGPTTE